MWSLWGSGKNEEKKETTAAKPERVARPVETFQEMFLAIDEMCNFKRTLVGDQGERPTKLVILQGFRSKGGHESIAQKTSTDELQETLNELSSKNIPDPLEKERRRIVNEMLGIVLANDDDIIKSLKNYGREDKEIDTILRDNDRGSFLAILESVGLPKDSPAMVDIKTYIVSARALLDEMRFGHLEKLDFLFPNEVRVAPAKEAIAMPVAAASMEEEESAAAPAPAPDAFTRAWKSHQKDRLLRPDRASRVGQEELRGGSRCFNELQDFFEQRQLRHAEAIGKIKEPETQHDKHLREIREKAKTLEQSRAAAENVAPEQVGSSTTSGSGDKQEEERLKKYVDDAGESIHRPH